MREGGEEGKKSATQQLNRHDVLLPEFNVFHKKKQARKMGTCDQRLVGRALKNALHIFATERTDAKVWRSTAL